MLHHLGKGALVAICMVCTLTAHAQQAVTIQGPETRWKT